MINTGVNNEQLVSPEKGPEFKVQNLRSRIEKSPELGQKSRIRSRIKGPELGPNGEYIGVNNGLSHIFTLQRGGGYE